MDKVLIVDGNPEFLEDTRKGLEKVRQFEALTAGDGDEAISVMSESPVSVLATDIETPSLDALELLAYMSQNHPNTPCIVMTDRGKPWFKKRISQQSFLYHLEKPFEIKSLVSALFVGLNLRDEGDSVKGMTMSSLLPLLELQQKTCRMQIRAEGRRKGFLYFEEGEIIDAHCGDLSGQEAAQEIASWNRISFSLSELPRRRSRRRVRTKLMDFADATWSTEKTAGLQQPASSEPGKEKEPIELVDEVIELKEEVEDAGSGEEEAFSEPESSEPGPSAEIRQKAEQWVEAIAAETRDIRDCRFIAVIGDNGDVLATQRISGDDDAEKLSLAMTGVLDVAAKAAALMNLDKTSSVALYAEKGTVIVQQLKNSKSGSMHAIVVCEPGRSWYFAKIRLEKLSF
ncbi:MAG: response regulator [Desulfobacterales bacterium]|nr:response regulator [Desulfobacterales bacterium]